MKQRNAVYYLCLVAFGTAINIIGSEIALWMRLPECYWVIYAP